MVIEWCGRPAPSSGYATRQYDHTPTAGGPPGPAFFRSLAGEGEQRERAEGFSSWPSGEGDEPRRRADRADRALKGRRLRPLKQLIRTSRSTDEEVPSWVN